jgi:hypothetical protein
MGESITVICKITGMERIMATHSQSWYSDSECSDLRALTAATTEVVPIIIILTPLSLIIEEFSFAHSKPNKSVFSKF